MPDKQIQCVECSQPFAFTEQMRSRLERLVQEGKIEQYHEPKRCHPCREAKKQRARSREK
jgi:predicted exporter